MNIIHFLKQLAIFSLFFLSCSEAPENQNEPKAFLEVQANEVTFTHQAGQRTIFVNTNRSFTATSSDPSWCVVSASDVSIIINVDENSAVAEQRAAEITIVCEDITYPLPVIQQGAEASIQVSRNNITISVLKQYAGENLDFSLDVNTNIPVVFELPTWISEKEGNAAVIGQKTYSFRADALPESIETRTGEVIIKSANEKIDKSLVVTVVQRFSEWELVWEEDFTSATQTNQVINTASNNVWNKRWRGTAAWARYMANHDGLHEIKDGNLILWGTKNTTHPQDNVPYFTAGVCTRWHRYFSLGKMEIRAKMESAQGAWPALWMVPETDVPWPHSGEIDIMEHLNFDNYVYHTIHTNYVRNLGNNRNPDYQAITHVNTEEWNVYAVELHSDSLVFRVNDIRTFMYPRLYKASEDKDGQFPFDQYPQFLLMTMQLGGADTWPGPINDDHLPLAMYIDWVRFYELK